MADMSKQNNSRHETASKLAMPRPGELFEALREASGLAPAGMNVLRELVESARKDQGLLPPNA